MSEESPYRRSAEVPTAIGNVGSSTLPSNNPDSVLENAFCCFDPSQEPNHIQRFAETLCERFWHAFKSNKFQPNLRFDSAACQKETLSALSPAWRSRVFHGGNRECAQTSSNLETASHEASAGTNARRPSF